MQKGLEAKSLLLLSFSLHFLLYHPPPGLKASRNWNFLLSKGDIETNTLFLKNSAQAEIPFHHAPLLPLFTLMFAPLQKESCFTITKRHITEKGHWHTKMMVLGVSTLSLRANLVFPVPFLHDCSCFIESKCRHILLGLWALKLKTSLTHEIAIKQIYCIVFATPPKLRERATLPQSLPSFPWIHD